MKKLLLLGGSAQQVIAITTAKQMGYETILCDYLPDNPGQYEADRFYLISTTDLDAVLEVARKEKIDGVLAYASDPAAPTAAYVAEQLGLPGNPYRSVDILCSKDKFRKFLAENGFHAPQSRGYDSVESVCESAERFRYPVIVKPVDSSGSKGATVLHGPEGLVEAAEFALSFSRCHRLIVEDFIVRKHPYLVGGDIFVVDGEIVLWGLMNCHRDACVNPLVPVGKSYPPQLEQKDFQNIQSTLQSMVTKLGIQDGALNVELIVDDQDRVWPIDIGPRCGGNMIPDLLGMIFDVNMVEMSIQAAMGIPVTARCKDPKPYYATHNLHAARDGVLEEIHIAPELEPMIIRRAYYQQPGSDVHYFDNASKALGILFFRFESEEQMHHYLTSINDYIEVRVR